LADQVGACTTALRPLHALRVDYRAMKGMIFGDPPEFEAVLDSIRSLETRLNKRRDMESEAAR
jgi:hypothetical protein